MTTANNQTLPHPAPRRAWRAATFALETHGPRLALMAIITGLTTWMSIDLTRIGGVSTVWIANGIVVGALLLRPHGQWSALLLASLVGETLARGTHGDPAALTIGLAAVNALEIALITGAIRRVVPDITQRGTLVPLSIVATSSTIVASLVSASIAGLLIANWRGVPFTSTAATWFTAHLLGTVIVATLTVVALRERWDIIGRPGRRLDFALSLVAVLGVAAVVFTQSRFPLLFLVYLPLLLVTFRHGFAGVVLGIAVIAIVAGVATANGLGPAALVRHSTPIVVIGLLQLFIGAGSLLTLPVAIVLSERERLSARLRQSESRYRMLADHTRDLVVRLRADGRPLYVSRSVTAMLGYSPDDLFDPEGGFIHPDDREHLREELRRLARDGGTTTATYRIRHRDGYYIWIEAFGERVATADPTHEPEVVYSCRDITARVVAEEALTESQSRLQAVTDNVPGFISHVDASQRYTFVNATLAEYLGRSSDAIIGRTIREVRGEAFHDRFKAQFEGVLRGHAQVFEGEHGVGGKVMYFKSHYVPDFGADGQVRGFFALTYDITAQKLAERKLQRLARVDSLTGLANRREFDERVALALARTRRHKLPLALLTFDVDKFKQINDTHGHAVGDEVLRQFALRLQQTVYAEDVVARLGGDEFVVLIENVGSPDLAEVIARKLIVAMREPVTIDDALSLHVSTSVGIAFIEGDTSAEELMAISDKALYAAKAAGRNTFRLISADDRTRHLREAPVAGEGTGAASSSASVTAAKLPRQLH